MPELPNYAESRTRRGKDGLQWVAVQLLGPTGQGGMLALAVPPVAKLPAPVSLVLLEFTAEEKRQIAAGKSRIVRPG